tara:strand:- start:1133 stop:1360 length:228 start_codon:yes stop_codon:yes gene_type:complete
MADTKALPQLIQRAFDEGGEIKYDEKNHSLHSIEGRGWSVINGESEWHLLIDSSKKGVGDVLDLYLGTLLLNKGE